MFFQQDSFHVHDSSTKKCVLVHENGKFGDGKSKSIFISIYLFKLYLCWYAWVDVCICVYIIYIYLAFRKCILCRSSVLYDVLCFVLWCCFIDLCMHQSEQTN
jgi:hypothetical protein